MSNWFDVDKAGLKKIQSEKDKFFILQELISNAFDEEITFCNIDLQKLDDSNSRTYQLTVEDDSPDGFKDLSHSYTLFADSYKKGNVKQRGRFNIGEKFALSMFDYASITSTKGNVTFDKTGRSKKRTSRNKGTIFLGMLKLTKEEYESIISKVKDIIVPNGVNLKVNGSGILRDELINSFEVSLPTIIADEEGNLKKSIHQTVVEIYPKSKDKGMIFELGIPVVESDIDYNVNVLQKVPLNKDRDNITPSFRKTLCTEVLNNCFKDLSKEQVKNGWVTDALEDAKPEAVNDVISKKHGEDAVVFDPNDPEANHKAYADGREVIHGGSYNKKVWNQIKTVSGETGQFKSSGQYVGFASAEFQSGAEELPIEKWTDGMSEVVAYAKKVHQEIIGIELKVSIHNGNGASAVYNKRIPQIQFFYKVLGRAWFNLKVNKEDIIRLLIHEFGHYYCSDHLDENYYRALCRIGSRWVCKKL